MTKTEATDAIKGGATLLYSRASMGSKAFATVNRQRIRLDTARRLIEELGLKPDKPFGVTKSYRLPCDER